MDTFKGGPIKLFPLSKLKIQDKWGNIVPFVPNEAQDYVLCLMEDELSEKGYTWVIVIKGRQMGLSTLGVVLGMSITIANQGKKSFSMGHIESTTLELFKVKAKNAWELLPKIFKNLFKVVTDSGRKFEIKVNGYDNVPSSFLAGLRPRGHTLNYLHGTELGKIQQKVGDWLEFKTGALNAAKQADIIFLETTPDGGYGELYTWIKSIQDDPYSKFTVVFLPWWLMKEYRATVPEEDDWKEELKRMIKIYSLENVFENQELDAEQVFWYYLTTKEQGEDIRSQYPNSINEAFQSSNKSRFTSDLINEFMNNIIKPIDKKEDVMIYRQKELNQFYIISADTSTGLGDDYSTISVRGYYPRDGKIPQYASFKGKISEDEAADMIVSLAEYYSDNKFDNVFLAIEANKPAVQDRARNYWNVPENCFYRREQTDVNSKQIIKQPKFGFYTDNQNRPLMVNNYLRLMVNKEIEINDLELLKEMPYFVWNDKNKKYEAQKHRNDDALTCDFINIYVRDYVQKQFRL